MTDPDIVRDMQAHMREQVAMKQFEPLLDRAAVESMIRSAIEAFARTQTEKEALRQKARSEMFQRFQDIISAPDCEELLPSRTDRLAIVCDDPDIEYRMRPATEADLEAHSLLTLPPQTGELVVFQAEEPPESAPHTELPLTLLAFDPEQGRHWILEPLQSPQEADRQEG